MARSPWSRRFVIERSGGTGLWSKVAGLEDLRGVWAGRVTADEVLRPERYLVRFPEKLFPPRSRARAEYWTTCAEGYEAARRMTVGVGVLLYNRVDLVDKLHARLSALSAVFGNAHMYVLAGDSTDGTDTAVRTWCRDRPDVYRWVPPPEVGLAGVRRYAVLRNALLEAIEEETPDLVMMLDGDLEGPLSLDGLAHSVALLAADDSLSGVTAFGINNWVGLDTCAPFLGYTYYDPFAFRERRWRRTSPDALVRFRLGLTRRGDPPFEVKSAFAGCALYKSLAISGLRYDVASDDCEHVGFHRALSRSGGRLCVNPSMLLLSGRQGHHVLERPRGGSTSARERPSGRGTSSAATGR